MEDTTMIAPAIPENLPRHEDPARQRGRGLLKVLVGVTAVAGIAGGVLIALSAGNPAGAGLSVLYAVIPLPFLWWAYWWLDRYEPEPRRYKVAAFVWGGVVAVAIALSLEVLIQNSLGLSDATTASFVAPLIEEPAKCLFLLLTFLRARRVIDGFIDGVIYAGIVGLGFAVVENIGYYAAAYLGSPDIKVAGAEGVTLTFIVRGVFSPLAHPLFASAFGIAVGLAVTRKTKTARWLICLTGLAVSIALHTLWNGSLSYGGGAGFLLTYIFLNVVLLVLAILVIVARARQVRVLERSLLYVADRGWIHPDEIPYLSRFGYRKAARRYATQQFGKPAGAVVKRYQQLATEMAFLHDAVMTGRTKPHGIERTYAMLDSMYELRPYLRFPPALRNTPHQH
ncbi:MAG: PrsW family intramembrane metalloprotease [Aeromicrobium sp.]